MNNFGIYKIVNTITGDVYIGSTIESFKKRWSKHISSYENYSKKGKRNMHPKLYHAFDKYDINNFKFEIIWSFKTRKEQTRSIILRLEERLINRIDPKYNICKKPTLSGCPNLGTKLMEEWKNNIAKKSKLYKHDVEALNKVTLNNKNNSSIYFINNEFRGSLIECVNYYNVDPGTIINSYNGKHESNIIKTVIKEKSQKKKITLYLDEPVTFNSYGECDRFLNMWRGFTSTQVIRNEPLILNYKYKIN